MKRHLYNIFLTLFAVTSLTLVACSDDDDSDVKGMITINGKSWTLSEEPVFTGHIGGDTYKADLVTAEIILQDDDFLFPSILAFDFLTYTGTHVGIGSDLATSEDVFWGGGNSLYRLGLDWDWNGDQFDGILRYTTFGTYGQSLGVLSGSAVIMECEDKELLTIKFSKYTLPLDTSEYHTSNAPETLVLDGTVTFTYTESLPVIL